MDHRLLIPVSGTATNPDYPLDARFRTGGILGIEMVGLRFAAALWALVLLGPLLDPHAHDPYHAHWVLSEAAGSPRWDVPAGQFPAGPGGFPHAPGVVWLRGADPSVPAVVHGGALVPGAAAPFLLVPPAPTERLGSDSRSFWTSVDPEPEDPPPRRS